MLLQHQRGVLIAWTLLVCALVGNTAAAIDETISEHEGKTVVLPCPVNKEKCGELHSINWFKGDDRIAAMLLDDSNVTSVTDEFQNRVTVEQNPFRLVIKDLQISDEDIYLCDTTFFIPIETCDNFNGYRVELNVLVPPTEVVILDEKGDRIENDTILGPMQERQMLKASCVVRNTRPQPQVGWWRGNKRLTTHSPSYDEKDGLYTATLELALQLSRDDLGHDIECRVESAALPDIIKSHFSVDLQVRPTSITINGVEHHTVQGSKVVLTCDIHGARPPVNLTWYNSTADISPEENDLTEIRTKAFEKADGTYHTQSELIFNATRFENDKVFRCDAENVVLQINREKPFTASLTLEVLYPPVVKVSPPEITVNTSDTVLLNCEYVANPASLTQVMWYRNGEMVHVNDTERYEGGNSENVALVIRSTDKEDIGNYSCQLSNVIGKAISEQQIDLDVQYVPIVEVLMIPEGPVRESDESNVTLYCNVLEANPAVLTRVRWYANSTLLKELPDCEETREDLCHIDPSKLLLESIGRGFFYNYSCEGYNAAGWGLRSDDKELMVHYEPGPATLTHFPLVAVKKKSVTFSCSVDEPGYPESNRYRWLRGGRGPLQDIVTRDFTVEPVGLDSRTNYSCYAYNEGGKGVMATVNLEVHAPPFFIKNLQPYTGMQHSAHNANLTCRIECVPRCEISWLKDGVAIDRNDTRYFVKEKYMDASPATGDFESMLSVLHFNMSSWPNKKFDIEADNANYTCVSTGNTVGAGIKSATYFSIEYAPDNSTVSEDIVYVQEDTIPGRVICKSRANPEPTYEWRHNNKTVIRGNALIINTPMTRNDTGRYTCLAFNKHGRNTVDTFIDVQFKPRCEIERREIDDQDTLICTAFGNPEEADFSWSIKAENETVEWLGSGDSKTNKDKSFYVLDEDYAIARTYRCVANNTAGAGAFCEIEVAEQLAWWQRWDKTALIILVAAILALLLAVIIICCIIICICRRRRRQDKYKTDVSISATQSVLSYQTTLPQVGVALPIQETRNEPTAPSSLLPSSIAPLREPGLTSTPLVATSNASITANTTTDSTNTNTTTTNHNNNNSTTNPSTPTLSIKHHTQAPKSPPRWPLRPGVMVHVSSDTKENLAVNRMTLKPKQALTTQLSNVTAATSAHDSTLSASTTSAFNASTSNSLLNKSTSTAQSFLLNTTAQSGAPLVAATLGRLHGKGSGTAKRAHAFRQSACHTLPSSRIAKVNANNQILTVDSAAMTAAGNADDNAAENERLTATERTTPLGADSEPLAQNACANNAADGIRQAAVAEGQGNERTCRPTSRSRLERVESFFTSIFKRGKREDSTRDSQRSHVGLLGGVFSGAKAAFRKRDADAAAETPFDTQHRLKGIRCSGSVTYKKTPECSNAAESNTDTPPNANLNIANPIYNTNTNTNNNTTNNNNNSVTADITIDVAAPSTTLSSPRSRASVTFQTPSLGKGRAPAIPQQPNTSSTSNNTLRSPTSVQRGILKSPTPPPRPPPPFRAAPPPLLKRTVVVSPSKIERVQIHDKSSSLADPLTEPGEYENLPFHGLQTAPNKFSTTPTNFNNNTNVVRVAPRPKRLNGNISQTQQQQPYDQQQLQYHQQQQQQQQQYSTMQYARTSCQQPQAVLHNSQTMNTHSSNAHNPHSLSSNNIASSGGSAGGGTLANPHQIAYNLNNCFPKSYTEYYHQQQQQKYAGSSSGSGSGNGSNNNTASNAQLLNAIEHDYPPPAYAVVERSTGGLPPPPAINTNPFLAVSNFKKYDTDSGGVYDGIMATGSMHRNKRNKTLAEKPDDKKFYSLKFNGGGGGGGGGRGKQAAPHRPQANSLLPPSNGKCKRHHSFAGGSIGDIDSHGPYAQQQQQLQASQLANGGQALRFYDPPVYENFNDSVQVHECAPATHAPLYQQQQLAPLPSGTATVLLHPQPHSAGSQLAAPAGPKKKHHHRQHQQKDDFNLIEPERLSIYRSDSGISNSSYECVTPVPAAAGSSSATRAQAGSTPPPKTPKSLKSSKANISACGVAASVPNAHKKSPRLAAGTPVYMNLADGGSQPTPPPPAPFERSSSPLSTIVNSSYESASSSQNDGTGACSTDPTSLSSSNSLYSSGTGTLVGSISSKSNSARCNRHQKPPEITTPEEFEQYQLGHHAHSASSLSVASSVSASGRKCKKRTGLATPEAGGNSGVSQPAKLATNPFLAARHASNAPTAATATTKCSKQKLRRQTISDPYAHISYISSNNNNNGSSCSNNTQAYNNSAQSAYACKATGATATAAATTTTQCRQQIGLQQQQRGYSTSTECLQLQRQLYQQQMLMPHEQQLLLLQQQQQQQHVARHRLLPLSASSSSLNAVEAVAAAAVRLPLNPTAAATTTAIESNAADTSVSAAANWQQQSALAAGYIVRPIKLPLRKHHSFHFQPSQTVAGIQNCQTQQLCMQLQQQQQQQQQQQSELLFEQSPQRYAAGGPLIFRPIALNEKHAFKPISPDSAASYATKLRNAGAAQYDELDSGDFTQLGQCRVAISATSSPADSVVVDEDEPKSEQSEQLCAEVQQITKVARVASMSLNPAASLEALEELTRTNPELIYASNKPGSRRNLHQQLALQQVSTQSAASEEEDLGYSYCEEFEAQQGDATATALAHNELSSESDVSPNATVILTASPRGGGQVKYMLMQSHREVQI